MSLAVAPKPRKQLSLCIIGVGAYFAGIAVLGVGTRLRRGRIVLRIYHRGTHRAQGFDVSRPDRLAVKNLIGPAQGLVVVQAE